ncbi:MAG: glutathione S-transferase family protein [Candidatus Binatia bacterium]
MAVKLYSTTYCPYAWRTRIVLHEKGLPFDVFEVDLKAKQSEFLTVSPCGKVPVMVDGTTTLTESMAINEYLEEKWPNPNLVGDTPAERAAVRTAIIDLNWNRSRPLARLAAMLFYEREGKDQGKIDQQMASWNTYLDELEAVFSEQTWLVLDRFSMADLSLYTTEAVTRHGFGLGRDRDRPHLDAWRERVAARDTVRKSAPLGMDIAA